MRRRFPFSGFAEASAHNNACETPTARPHRHFIFTAGLLAPSALLAAGGDVSGQTSGLAPLTRTGVPPAAAVSYNPAGPTRTQLYQQSEVGGAQGRRVVGT